MTRYHLLLAAIVFQGEAGAFTAVATEVDHFRIQVHEVLPEPVDSHRPTRNEVEVVTMSRCAKFVAYRLALAIKSNLACAARVRGQKKYHLRRHTPPRAHAISVGALEKAQDLAGHPTRTAAS